MGMAEQPNWDSTFCDIFTNRPTASYIYYDCSNPRTYGNTSSTYNIPQQMGEVFSEKLGRFVNADDLADLENAEVCRHQNLRHLYRPPVKFRLRFVRKPMRIVHQPCWSSKRWRSVT